MSFKQWQIYIPKIKIHLPIYLKNELDVMIDDMTKSEMDIVILIDGKEGTGKSKTGRVLGGYIAHIVESKFAVENIHFDVWDYMKFSERSNKYTINILDESREALNKRRGMSKSNVFFTNWLSENRDKQQVHIIILPAVHDIDSYISIWRMSMLIHHLKFHGKSKSSRSGYELVRGFFKVYGNNKNLHQVLFNKGKYGYYSYPKQWKIFGKLRNNEVFTDEELEEYKEKKAQLRKDKYSESVSKDRARLVRLVKHLNENGDSQEKIATFIGETRNVVQGILKDKVESLTNKATT